MDLQKMDDQKQPKRSRDGQSETLHENCKLLSALLARILALQEQFELIPHLETLRIKRQPFVLSESLLNDMRQRLIRFSLLSWRLDKSFSEIQRLCSLNYQTL